MIKVMVIDDSAFMRQIFKKTINRDPERKVISTAYNGEKGLELIQKLKPDVVTLDIEMPKKNGLDTLKEIIKMDDPVPVIMVSALDNDETVMKALEIGAFDFIPKPSGTISLNIDDIINELLLKLKSAVKSKKPEKINIIRPNTSKLKNKKIFNFPVLGIGSSSGGPKALKEIITVLPKDFPAAIVIVQHMPPGFTASLAKRLNQESNIKVKEAEEGDIVQPGLALIAPGDYHLEITENEKVSLNQKPQKWGVRPCVDYMLESIASIYKKRNIGLILTGMGHDGAIGMKKIKKNNGYGIVEDRSTALVYGMPSATIKENAYDEIVPLTQIPNRLIRVIERRY